MVEAQPVQDREQLARVAELLAQLDRAPVGLAGGRGGEAVRRDVAAAEREPERELPPQAPLCARQVLEPGEGGAELGEGLRERRAGEGAAPGPLVVVDRLLRQPRLAEVVREQLGLGLGGLREALLEDLRDPARGAAAGG